jgi:hypothetical protein
MDSKPKRKARKMLQKTTSPATPPNPDRLVGDKEVLEIFGYGAKRNIPALIKAGFLPPPIEISLGKKGQRHRRRWHRGVLLAWLRERAERAAETAQ